MLKAQNNKSREAAMKLFFDESGFSGCIMPNKNGKLYNDGQRHFVLGGVFVKDEIDEENLINRYREFKKSFGFGGEAKGSDLMTSEKNEALSYFLNEILDGEHFYICNYDKLFYLATLISIFIFGRTFQETEPLIFYQLTSALAGEKESLFIEYCKAVQTNTEESKRTFLKYIIYFPYEKLERNETNFYISFAKKMLDEHFYDDFPLVYDAYSCKNTVNFLNMTALGEILICMKYLHKVDINNVSIFHDHLLGYEEEYNQSFAESGIKINFVDSRESELIQLADNVSSIYRKCFEKSFQAFRNGRQWQENIWFTENYSLFLNKVGMEHIKMTTQIADWVLPYVVKDIFGVRHNAYLNNKDKYWPLFFQYREDILQEISRLDVTVEL